MEKQISSGLKNLFLIHFVLALLFGLVFLFVPFVYGSIIGWEITDAGAFRLIGAAMLGFSASSWLAFKNPLWEKVKITVIMEVLWTCLGALATVWAILFEGFPPAAWLNAVLLALFAVFFFIFYRKESR